MLGHTWSVWCTAIQCSGLSLPLTTPLDSRPSRDVRQGSSSARANTAESRTSSLSSCQTHPNQ